MKVKIKYNFVLGTHMLAWTQRGKILVNDFDEAVALEDMIERALVAKARDEEFEESAAGWTVELAKTRRNSLGLSIHSGDGGLFSDDWPAIQKIAHALRGIRKP